MECKSQMWIGILNQIQTEYKVWIKFEM